VRILKRFLIVLAAGCVTMHAAAVAQIVLKSSVLGGGGSIATNGSSLIAGTIAQPVIGPITSNTIIIGQGFWYVLPAASISGVRYSPGGAGSAVVLHQNTPNPFTAATAIAFDLPSAGHVSLKLYDAMGHEVRTLVEDVRQAGRTTVIADADGLESGTYTARLIANGASRSIMMVVVH
jgi:hypothetical protein